MKENLTELVFIVDRSGSMTGIADDVIGGFNSFLEDQKKVEGQEANVTVALFDNEYSLLYDNININEVEKLDRYKYQPRGMTALLDAIGRTVTSVGIRLANQPEEDRPSKVMVVIITDGYENSSLEYHAAGIKEMIKEQEEVYSWDFIFVAANMDVVTVGNDYGIVANKTMNFGATSKGVSDMSMKIFSYTTSYRCAFFADKSSLVVDQDT